MRRWFIETLKSRRADMTYQAKDYHHLIGLKGFSEKLLKNHFSLYEGYVKTANLLIGHLERLVSEGAAETPEFSGIQRRLSFELNGIKLHEYYFENMIRGGNAIDTHSAIYKKLTETFGSYEKWHQNFVNVAETRGIGWAMVIYDPATEFVFNIWIESHHVGHVAGCIPLLVLDLWEHALLLDYGSNRATYLDAFFETIHWSRVSQRFEAALLWEEAGILNEEFKRP